MNPKRNAVGIMLWNHPKHRELSALASLKGYAMEIGRVQEDLELMNASHRHHPNKRELDKAYGELHKQVFRIGQLVKKAKQ